MAPHSHGRIAEYLKSLLPFPYKRTKLICDSMLPPKKVLRFFHAIRNPLPPSARPSIRSQSVNEAVAFNGDMGITHLVNALGAIGLEGNAWEN